MSVPMLLIVQPLPAPGDETLFSDYEYRNRAYGEADLSDKPTRIQQTLPLDTRQLQTFQRNQLRALQAVDRAVGAIVDKLEAKNKLAQTVLIFTSDNGYLWGEHGLQGKGEPYEESIRVPLVIVLPGIAPRTDDHLVAMNLDVPQTIFDLAGISKDTDGVSLVPLLQGDNSLWRTESTPRALYP